MEKKYKLDPEEQEVLKDFENDEYFSILTEERKSKIVATAKNTIAKNKRINIRMSERDFDRVQVKAIEENIPYQTLIGSIIHKYLDGRYIEKQ